MIAKIYKLFKQSKGLVTDSRTLKAGEIFLAIKGDKFDGNLYALDALNMGAAYVIIDKGSKFSNIKDERIIVVDDTLRALTELANYHRNQLKIPIVGLTGTNGKTTTKELIGRVLATKYKVISTKGNLNNDIGVPLSLLSITENTEIAVIEMGANHPDDIDKLVKVVEPNIGLITNVGKAHLQGFGSFEGVCKAKGKLYDYLINNGKTIILNHDDAVLMNMAKDRGAKSIFYYGLKYWMAGIVKNDSPYLKMRLGSQLVGLSHNITIETNLVGNYNANNVLAAIAVGIEYNVPIEDAVKAISEYNPTNNRSQMLETHNNKLIVDAYNANPTSMSLAIDSFESYQGDNKILLLGSMGELGQDSLEEHKFIINKCKSLSIKWTALVGEEFRRALEESDEDIENITWFNNSESLGEYLSQNKISSSLVLIKGSRSAEMEKVIPYL